MFLCNLGRLLEPLDIPFDRVAVSARSSNGLPYTRWATVGMPQLGQYKYLLDIVFFLFPSVEAAERGEDAGGTGFLVGIPSEAAPDHYHHLYAVTNWHVAVNGGSSVLRFNGTDGKTKVLDFEPHEWEFIPGDHDIAVIPIDLNQRDFKAQVISAPSFFLTDKEIVDSEIDAGEDVFMLGRFVDYDGKDQRNQPAMRFGNISMMEARVKQPTGFSGPSTVVDMHSRTGFSGSPVFTYRTSGSLFPKDGTLIIAGHMMKLLGILWGQFPEAWDINDPDAPPTMDGKKKTLTGMSGMSLVSPASEIWKALHTPRLKELRAAKEAELRSFRFSGPIKMDLGPPSLG